MASEVINIAYLYSGRTLCCKERISEDTDVIESSTDRNSAAIEFDLRCLIAIELEPNAIFCFFEIKSVFFIRNVITVHADPVPKIAFDRNGFGTAAEHGIHTAE